MLIIYLQICEVNHEHYKSNANCGGILVLALKLFVRFGSEDLTALSSLQRGRHTYALCAFCNFRLTPLRELANSIKYF